ncbi:MAG: polysaccharide pyruvyl transferase CsaB [Atribacterota bacterium]|nr:polysaccharide pyruvyl transferase CsaB [Atribacterota bacterium]
MKEEANKVNSIMISGYFGFGNCGDEAILMAMIQELSRYIPKENIVVLSQSPKKTKEKYRVNALHRLNLFLILSQLRKLNVFISGGGGLLQDISGKGFSIIYYLGLIILARLFKVSSVIYAQGIGPIRRQINRKIIKLVLTRINLIIVRDEKSQLLLQEIGIDKKSVSISADPSFLLRTEELPNNIAEKYQLNYQQGMKDGKMTIGVVIRNCKEIEHDYKQKIINLAKIADYLIEKYQVKLIFLPFQVSKDLTLLNDIIKEMKHSSVDCLNQEVNPAQMLSLFSQLSLIIGMRFHAIIFATISNRPFIAIDYDPKVRNYVDSLGLSELLLNLNQLTIKNIDNKLKYIKDHQNEIKSILNSATKQYQDKANAGNDNLRSFIEGKHFRFRKELK